MVTGKLTLHRIGDIPPEGMLLAIYLAVLCNYLIMSNGSKRPRLRHWLFKTRQLGASVFYSQPHNWDYPFSELNFIQLLGRANSNLSPPALTTFIKLYPYWNKGRIYIQPYPHSGTTELAW